LRGGKVITGMGNLLNSEKKDPRKKLRQKEKHSCSIKIYIVNLGGTHFVQERGWDCMFIGRRKSVEKEKERRVLRVKRR